MSKKSLSLEHNNRDVPFRRYFSKHTDDDLIAHGIRTSFVRVNTAEIDRTDTRRSNVTKMRRFDSKFIERLSKEREGRDHFVKCTDGTYASTTKPTRILRFEAVTTTARWRN